MSDVHAAAAVAAGNAEPIAAEVLSAVAKAVGSKAGTGIWVDVRTGVLDKGTTVTVYERGKLGLLGLIGRRTFGAALGYDVAKAGPIEVSVFAGAAHPYEGALRIGWKPVAGVSLRF